MRDFHNITADRIKILSDTSLLTMLGVGEIGLTQWRKGTALYAEVKRVMVLLRAEKKRRKLKMKPHH